MKAKEWKRERDKKIQTHTHREKERKSSAGKALRTVVVFPKEKEE